MGSGTGERDDLVQSLDARRRFLLRTVQGLSDDQAAQRTTVSELCLGGIIKHLTLVERQWVNFIKIGPTAMGSWQDEANMKQWLDAFQMLPGDTLAGLIEEYDKVARQTDELVVELPDLDASQPLPEAPWNEPGARWSARRVLLHIVGETAQHAGHADIIRESLDGAKTMG